MEQGPGEPAERERGQFPWREPGEFAELAVTGCRGAGDDPGLVNGGD